MVQEHSESIDDDDQVPEVIRLEGWYLSQPKILERICSDLNHHLYLSDDWSPDFYVAQAYHGFVAVAFEDVYLLPELQKSYCILNFADLKLTNSFRKNVNKLLKKHKITVSINRDIDGVLGGIDAMHIDNNWLRSRYRKLAKRLLEIGNVSIEGSSFRFLSVEVWQDGELVAGEVGYAIGRVYTSLTGYCVKGVSKTSYGLVQMALLCKLLARSGFAFWNLGHPPRKNAMRYKAELGGVVISRSSFLSLWRNARDDDAAVEKLIALNPHDAIFSDFTV